MHYPHHCRPVLAASDQMQIANGLVEADPRVASPTPPPHVQTAEAEARYHKQRAQVLRNILVQVTCAYNVATGEPALHLPLPPPQAEVEEESMEDEDSIALMEEESIDYDMEL